MTTFTSTEFGLLLAGAVMAALFVTLIAPRRARPPPTCD